MSDVAAFLALLYGDDPPGFVAVYNGRTKLTTWCLASAREHVAAAVLASARHSDTYIGFGLQHELMPPDKRGSASGVIAWPGFTLDFDITHPTAHAKHARPYVPDLETAGAIVRKFPLRPTATVLTGHGLLLLWLFRELWTLENDEERRQADHLSRRFQAHMIGLASDAGYQVDNTADLARIVRPVGTFNRKVPGDVKAVTFLRPPRAERRYNPSDFDEILPEITEREAPEIGDAAIGQIPLGSRHGYLTRLAGAMRAVGATDAEILAALTVANAARFAEPKTLRQVADVAADIPKRYKVTRPVSPQTWESMVPRAKDASGVRR